MLILEGTDCVGKTTLSHKLAAKLGLAYQHLGPLPDSWSDEDYVKLASDNVVRDRYHLSEVAYSLALKRQVKIRDLKTLHSTLLLKYGAYVVLMTAEDSVIKPRFDPEVELFSFEEVMRVNGVFEDMKFYADYRIHLTESSATITDKTIDNICESYKRRQQWIHEWGGIMRSLK